MFLSSMLCHGCTHVTSAHLSRASLVSLCVSLNQGAMPRVRKAPELLHVEPDLNISEFLKQVPDAPEPQVKMVTRKYGKQAPLASDPLFEQVIADKAEHKSEKSKKKKTPEKQTLRPNV